MADRAAVLEKLADEVLSIERDHPVRVAVDGCSAAGKTTLADELADVLRLRTDRELIRAEIDHFKRAPELRTRYPLESPESYYFEMYDCDSIRERLLVPLGSGGDRRYVNGLRDSSAAEVLDVPVRTAAPAAILIADGAFLQRPELNDCWDLSMYVHVSFETVLRRGTDRDAAWMDSPEAAAHRYRTRYIPGERLYIKRVDPAARAHLVIDNENPARPILTRPSAG
ncbi:uridine kinase [Kribbella jejuensis]|uniref:Uridine kinase n=1 Tax=Kribbella jejuensis TaxID=236068 RepID=A0A542EPD7_9ACTN|nr:uridine kinase [Kribbella jejuensis]TQJ17198.1 uridine kinase [Kribbella jejuensis]